MADDDNCVFCAIAAGKIPAKKVYEDDSLAAVLDINPATDGHLLLIPKKHFAMLPQMDEGLVAHTAMVAKQLSAVLIRALKCEGTSIFAANGAAAGQRAPHVMIHIIPRKSGDEAGLAPKPQKLDEKTMKLVYDKLSPAIAKQFGKEPPKLAVEKKEPAAEKKSTAESEKKPAKEPDKKEGKEGSAKEDKKETIIEKKSAPKKSSLDDITAFLAGGKP